jgi:ligand-binding SRPBCC domain-containing protein
MWRTVPGRLVGLALAAGDRPDRGLVTRQWTTVVHAEPDVTFAFFADAANLERLTPAWVRFRVTTPLPVVMRVGLEIDYRITVRGLPMPWRSRIDVWEPGTRFVDRQMIGPYRWWWHTHEFETAPGGTRVVDTVEFLPRVAWATTPVVTKDVERIFAYRQQALAALF